MASGITESDLEVVQPNNIQGETDVEDKHEVTEKITAKNDVVECTFVEKPPSGLQTDCPVCLQILREPYQVTCCGKSFCRLCIEKIKSDNKSQCPTCKNTSFQDFPNKGLQQFLNQLKV